MSNSLSEPQGEWWHWNPRSQCGAKLVYPNPYMPSTAFIQWDIRKEITSFQRLKLCNLVKAISKFIWQWLTWEVGKPFGKSWPSCMALAAMGWVRDPNLASNSEFISCCRRLCSLTTGFFPCECPRIAAATWEQSVLRDSLLSQINSEASAST